MESQPEIRENENVFARLPQLTLARKKWWLALTFFLVCPVLLSLPLGIFQAGYGAYLPLEYSFIFWAAIWVTTWWSAEFALRVLHVVLKPWHIPLIVEIILAYFLAILAAALFVPLYMLALQEFTTNLPPDFFEEFNSRSIYQRVTGGIRTGTPGLLFWVLLRSIYAMFPSANSKAVASQPSKNSSPSATEAPLPTHAPQPQSNSQFYRELAKRSVHDLGLIETLKASDHYVEVGLSDRPNKVLVLSKFSDAVEDLVKFDGVRIHRSYWVSRKAIKGLNRDGNSMTVALVNGEAWPVSAKYHAHVEFFWTHANL